MSAYAQNTSDGGGFAPLSGSLLARKGEALPAVDANAHEGVDIDMRPMKPANSPGAPKQISEDSISKLYEHGQARQAKPGMRVVQGGRPETAAPAKPAVIDVAPEDVKDEAPSAWTLSAAAAFASEAQPRPQAKPVSYKTPDPLIRRRPATPDPLSGRRPTTAPVRDPSEFMARKAVVSLRMPARELVRLRLASKDLEMTCQAIILDALECYLDANDVPSASDDDAITREAERLIGRVLAKKRD